jgi:hypothetical protein
VRHGRPLRHHQRQAGQGQLLLAQQSPVRPGLVRRAHTVQVASPTTFSTC